MATVSESNANFIQGLSDLWVRFFKDKPTLEALYSGMEIPVGQAYLDLLSNVLNISVRETPIFRKEFFKLLTVREDLVTFDLSTATYKFELTNLNIRDFKFLYNKIFAPTVILEKQVDFTLEVEEPIGELNTEMGMDAETDIDYLTFSKDPFDWEGDGLPIPGVAYRTVDVAQDDGTVTRERELAFWIPDAQVDAYDLYLNYGYLLNYFAPSSESYRALLQGIIQYFVLGPTTQHLVSALNVMTGLPLVRDDGEVLQSVDTSDPLYQVVKTSRANYQFGVEIPLRADVLDTDNWGVLTFSAFEHLSDLFHVHDTVAEPTWFFDSTIPLELLPDEPRDRRVICPGLWENKINNPEGLVRVGDPGFIVGCDEDGSTPTGDRAALRHSFSYIVFERFLRHHVFTVEFDPDAVMSGAVPFPRFTRDLMNVVTPGKSAYTFLMVEPALTVTDVLHLYSEQMSILVRATDEALVGGVPNQLRIGDTRYPWDVGDYYTYDSSSVVVNHWPIGNRFENGKTPFSLGGASPTNRGGLVTSKPSGGFFNVASGEGYLQHTNDAVPFGAALVNTDVGRCIYRPLTGTWFRITRLTTFFIIGIPIRIRVTAYLDSVPSPVTPSGLGEAWSLYSTPTPDQLVDWAPQIEQVGGFPTCEVWAVGSGLAGAPREPLMGYGEATTGLALKYDGVRIRENFVGLGKRDEDLTGVWVKAADDVWVVGTRYMNDLDMPNREGMVYHWDGLGWTQMLLIRGDPFLGYTEGFCIGGIGDEVWVGATGLDGVYHWDGTQWVFRDLSTWSYVIVHGVWASATDNVYLVGTGSYGVWLWDGANITPIDVSMLDDSYSEGIWGSSDSDIWIIGNAGGVYHWNGSVWACTTPFASGFLPRAIHGIDASDIWVVGYNEISSSEVIYHWNGSAWSIDDVGDPAWNYTSIWAKSSSEVYATETDLDGTYSRIRMKVGAAWPVFWGEQSPRRFMYAIGGI